MCVIDMPCIAPIWRRIARTLASASEWAERQAKPGADTSHELMLRLRMPVRFGIRHPIDTIRRKADRRHS